MYYLTELLEGTIVDVSHNTGEQMYIEVKAADGIFYMICASPNGKLVVGKSIRETYDKH